MAKKYVSLTRLTEYDGLIKAEIAKKANASHNHDDRYYTETEIDNKLSAVNTSIDNITSGEVVVEEAKHAENATTAESCTGNAATATTASKLGTTTVGSTTQPIYLNNGVATGVTKIDIAHGGTNATTAADARTNLGVYSATEVDTKLSGKSDTSHNHDTKYDTKGAASTAETNSKSYTDEKIALLLENSSEAVDSIYELRDAMVDNADAIEALNGIAAGKANASHTHTVSHITDLTATATELNYMDGVTSNVQTQLDTLTTAVNGKAASGHSHTITAGASDDDVVVLTGTNGTNGVTYSASHANSGVTAGTYRSVTVNAKGHVTAGTNPTTLSGYGITDAASKTHSHAISEITNLQTTLNNTSSAITLNTQAIEAHTEAISDLQGKVGDGFEEVTSAEIQALFAAQ